ncbi:insulinase family protein, partial [bacterium]|nr:insulinase family protein [bacterium]
SQADFEATKNFLLKYINILTNTQDRQLGYALDSRYYGIGDFTQHVAEKLRTLTVDDVNRVIKKYLQTKNIKFAFITKDAEDLRNRLINNTSSKMAYQAEKPAELLQEDKIIQDYKLDFKASKVIIRLVDDVFVNSTN